jgi:transcription initiation factor IIE alpha subunit
MMDKVLPILEKREFLHLCQKHGACPECGNPVQEETICTAVFDQVPSLHGTGMFNCQACGNKFRYNDYITYHKSIEQ